MPDVREYEVRFKVRVMDNKVQGRTQMEVAIQQAIGKARNVLLVPGTLDVTFVPPPKPPEPAVPFPTDFGKQPAALGGTLEPPAEA